MNLQKLAMRMDGISVRDRSELEWTFVTESEDAADGDGEGEGEARGGAARPGGGGACRVLSHGWLSP